MQDGESGGVNDGPSENGLGAVGHLVQALEVTSAVRIAVLDDLGADVAHEAPLDEAEIAHDAKDVGTCAAVHQSAIHGAGHSCVDALDAAHVEVQRNLRVEACVGALDANLAQRVCVLLGKREAVDVVQVVDGLNEVVDGVNKVGILRGCERLAKEQEGK